MKNIVPDLLLKTLDVGMVKMTNCSFQLKN